MPTVGICMISITYMFPRQKGDMSGAGEEALG